MKASIHENQLGAAAFVMLLSPALRLFPSLSAALAGKGAWLSALACFLPAGAFLFLACRLAERRREGEGLFELVARSAPGRPGRMALLFLSLWLSLYVGFVLRSGADRFVVTVYPNTPAAFFVLTMALAALAASFAPLRDAARTAALVFPAVAGTLALVLLTALRDVEAQNLLPVGPEEAGGVLSGLLPGLDVLSWAIFAAALLLPETEKGRSPFPRLLGWLGAGCAVLGLMSADVVGSFGPTLSAELTWPFFSLVRNLVFLRSIERVEALVVALWIFPDFLIVSLFFRGAGRALSLALERRLPRLTEGRWPLLFCAAAAVGFALLAAPSETALQRLSERIIPGINLFVCFVLLPALLGTGRIKGRI